jgi:hypothetical protein
MRVFILVAAFMLWAAGDVLAQADLSSLQENMAPRVANHKTVTTLDNCLSALPPEERLKLKSSTKPYGECLLLLRQAQKRSVRAGEKNQANVSEAEKEFLQNEGGGFVQVAPLLSAARQKEVQKKLSQEEALGARGGDFTREDARRAKRASRAESVPPTFEYNR